MDNYWEPAPSSNRVIWVIVIILIIIGIIILIVAIVNNNNNNNNNNSGGSGTTSSTPTSINANNKTKNGNNNRNEPPQNQDNTESLMISSMESLKEAIKNELRESLRDSILKEMKEKSNNDSNQKKGNSSGDTISLDELARQEVLASVEDIIDVGDKDNEEDDEHGDKNVSDILGYFDNKGNESTPEARQQVPQPQVVAPYAPTKQINDETFGYSVGISMTNPASLSSDFSDPTELPTTTTTVRRKKIQKHDNLKGIANIGKSTGKNNTMGPL